MSEGYKQRAKQLMEEKNLTMEAVAIGTGRGKATISRWLSDRDGFKTSPTLDDLQNIADFLKVPRHWLVFGIGDKHLSIDDINKRASVLAVGIHAYSRIDAGKFLNGEDVQPYETVIVPAQYKDCFAVSYPVSGAIAGLWDCLAIVDRSVKWSNDDLVLAKLKDDATPDFFTLVSIGSEIHMWYGDDKTQRSIARVTEDDLEVIGVVTWGEWHRRVR